MTDIILKAYSGEVPKYCWLCGRKLLRKQYFRRYDEQTGNELCNTKIYCPNSWKIFQAHEVTKFDSDGDEIIERYI